jgi:8-oxo-dGTP diphosphatase
MGVFPHDYPDRSVDISLWLVTGFGGDPQGLDGQALLWIPVEDLGAHDLLEADLPMLAPLREALRAG